MNAAREIVRTLYPTAEFDMSRGTWGHRTLPIKEGRAVMAAVKAGGCIGCGESRPSCLDFHHLDPRLKQFELGSRMPPTREDLEEELANCVVLCANCHRLVHAGELRLPETAK